MVYGKEWDVLWTYRSKLNLERTMEEAKRTSCFTGLIADIAELIGHLVSKVFLR